MVGIKLTRGNTGRTTSWNTDDPHDVGNQIHQLTGLVDSLVGSGRFESPAKATEHLTLAAEGLKRLTTEIQVEVCGPQAIEAGSGIVRLIPCTQSVCNHVGTSR